jgi:hypothetical protein
MPPIRGKGVDYIRQAREIILNVLRYFEDESFQETAPGRRPKTAVQHTVEATGVGRSTVYRLKNSGPTEPKKRGNSKTTMTDEADGFARGAIRRIIADMYEQKQWPTIKSIYNRVKVEVGFAGCEASFRVLLKDMGYKYGIR